MIAKETLFKWLVVVLLAFAPHQPASAQCAVEPLKPLPPIGCKDVIPQCVSSTNGRTYWNWVCVPQSGNPEVSNGSPRRSPAPDRTTSDVADQFTVPAASVNAIIIPPPTHLPIAEDSKSAVETLRDIAQRLEACPKVLAFETQWGKKADDILQFYYEPPANVIWDVVSGNSVRAPYLGFVEFTVTEDDWVPDSSKQKFWKITLADPLKLTLLNQTIGPQHYRYEYDLGPSGLQLTRVLYRKKKTGEWVESATDGLAKYCWDIAARHPETNANTLHDQRNPQDSEHATVPMRLAAAQTDLEAEYNRGVAYANGQGVPQNYVEAAAWFRKAAEQGFAEAQYNLGLLYANGHGLPQDDVQAVLWVGKAAVQGDAEAQLFLGLQYAAGHGVLQNYEEAYFWLNIALEKKLDPTDAQDAAQIRDEIKFHLPPADQARVQERARKWFEAHQAKPQ